VGLRIRRPRLRVGGVSVGVRIMRRLLFDKTRLLLVLRKRGGYEWKFGSEVFVIRGDRKDTD
jgi:hypothetical protein